MKTFQTLDTNNDGKLSREELLIGYKKIMDAVEADAEVSRIMSYVDTNNSGHIDYSGIVGIKRVRDGHDQPAVIVVEAAAGDHF